MATIEVCTENRGWMRKIITSDKYIIREIESERTNWNNLYAHIVWDDGREETYDMILWRYQNGCGRYPTYCRWTQDENHLSVWVPIENAMELPVLTPGHTNPITINQLKEVA